MHSMALTYGQVLSLVFSIQHFRHYQHQVAVLDSLNIAAESLNTTKHYLHVQEHQFV